MTQIAKVNKAPKVTTELQQLPTQLKRGSRYKLKPIRVLRKVNPLAVKVYRTRKGKDKKHARKFKGKTFRKFKEKHFRKRKKMFKSKHKPRDLQVQFVLLRGRRMRCITKADGRKIYRLPRVQQTAQGWKTKAETAPKKRKSDKVRIAFRHIVRSHNDMEARVSRKRKMYHRHKKLNDYLNGKLNTPTSIAYREHKRGRRFEQNLGVLLNRINPKTNMRKTQAQLLKGSVDDLKLRTKDSRGKLRQRRLVGGIVSFNPGTQVDKKSSLMSEQLKRLRKRRKAGKLPKFEGNQLEKLLGNRKVNAVAMKSQNHPLYDERLSRGWHRNGKHR